ncbi:MAG: septum formation initiator family protein [Candidatus Eisenbacteria bacterium]|nr:septum formation initiator family protein [Candidatus Eisenbacteria bacterium]
MRDIGARIQRYRLSRYAAPEVRVRRRWRWALLAAAVWLAYVGFLSEHSFHRIGQLSNQHRRSQSDLKRMNEEDARLEPALHDPAARLDLAEHTLREDHGMARKGEIIYRIHTDGTASR